MSLESETILTELAVTDHLGRSTRARLRSLSNKVYVIEITSSDWAHVDAEVLLPESVVAMVTLNSMRPFVFALR